MSGFKRIVEAIGRDLEKRLPKQRATQRRKLNELVGGILICQTPNLMELSNVLDRPTESVEARYNYVERFLKNPLVGYRSGYGCLCRRFTGSVSQVSAYLRPND